MYNEQRKLTFVMFSYLLMESSFKSILTRAEVRNHHLPFPGASSHGTRRGGRATLAVRPLRAVSSPGS